MKLLSEQEVIETIHKTILSFFEPINDNEEHVMTPEELKLLTINKTICKEIRNLSDKSSKTSAETKEKIDAFKEILGILCDAIDHRNFEDYDKYRKVIEDAIAMFVKEEGKA